MASTLSNPYLKISIRVHCQSPSPSPVGQSPSPSPTKVRVSLDLVETRYRENDSFRDASRKLSFSR